MRGMRMMENEEEEWKKLRMSMLGNSTLRWSSRGVRRQKMKEVKQKKKDTHEDTKVLRQEGPD